MAYLGRCRVCETSVDDHTSFGDGGFLSADGAVHLVCAESDLLVENVEPTELRFERLGRRGGSKPYVVHCGPYYSLRFHYIADADLLVSGRIDRFEAIERGATVVVLDGAK